MVWSYGNRFYGWKKWPLVCLCSMHCNVKKNFWNLCRHLSIRFFFVFSDEEKTTLNRIHFIWYLFQTDELFKILPLALTCCRRPTIFWYTLSHRPKFIYVMNSNTNSINGQTVLLNCPPHPNQFELIGLDSSLNKISVCHKKV